MQPDPTTHQHTSERALEADDALGASPKPRGRQSKKIAQLPRELRQRVNSALRDQRPYSEIGSMLANEGHRNITVRTLAAWHKKEYAEWLNEQERIGLLRSRSAAALQFADKLQRLAKTDLTSINHLVVASQINDILESFGSEKLLNLLESKPEQFFKLASAVSSQTSERTQRLKLELEFQKYRDHVAEQKRKIQELTRQPSSRKVLSKDVLHQIEEAARLL